MSDTSDPEIPISGPDAENPLKSGFSASGPEIEISGSLESNIDVLTLPRVVVTMVNPLIVVVLP
jgi:hypothetical protein